MANAPVDDQWYVDGSEQVLLPLAVVVVVVGIVVGVERGVELPPPAVEDAADDEEGRVPLGLWLVAALLPAATAMGLPGEADGPGAEEPLVPIGAASLAAREDPGGAVTRTAMLTVTTAATTTAANTPRRANNRRRPGISTFRLPATAEQGDRRLPQALPQPVCQAAVAWIAEGRTCLRSLSAVASARTALAGPHQVVREAEKVAA
ncbi:hypothetical protein [Catenulispora sp. GAS73]|uniref:hypothetical protein n=1 Tax=Catenulispora sp. GAS73 TaxID=3156269 RepID=UPI003511D192